MKPWSIIAFFGGFILSILAIWLMFPVAFADEPVTEPVGVFETQEDGSVTFRVVRLLPARPIGFENIICWREYGADTIRCYAVHFQTLEVRYADLKIVK